jgi:hypothetical protein
MFDRMDCQSWVWHIGLAAAVAWYPVLIGLLGFAPWRTLGFGLAFNSMAEHLLAGRFDVDPQASSVGALWHRCNL